MRMCKVSVLMPVYNAEKYLRQAIDSIVQQSYKDWEFVIVNDGSIDSTEDIIKSYDDKRICYFQNEKNLGVIKTLNKGIDFCQGEYIARMDADDTVHPDRLKDQVKFLDAHPDYVMCGTDGFVVDNDNNRIGKLRMIPFDEGIRIKLLFSNPFAHPSVMIRRSILQEERYSEEWKHVEDQELWTRIADRGKVANMKSKYLNYRWHGKNISQIETKSQEDLKTELLKKQLEGWGINPSEKDLYYHRLTFDNRVLDRSVEVTNVEFEGVKNWFSRLIDQNKREHKYSDDYFLAFLWSRWILLCIKKKRCFKIFSGDFVSFRPSVLSNLYKFILAGVK